MTIPTLFLVFAAESTAVTERLIRIFQSASQQFAHEFKLPVVVVVLVNNLLDIHVWHGITEFCYFPARSVGLWYRFTDLVCVVSVTSAFVLTAVVVRVFAIFLIFRYFPTVVASVGNLTAVHEDAIVVRLLPSTAAS